MCKWGNEGRQALASSGRTALTKHRPPVLAQFDGYSGLMTCIKIYIFENGVMSRVQ
jgi:hypothetical protein